jgi:predicted nucleic acid-binding protein
MASIYRKKREAGLREALIKRIVGSFLADWKSFIRVEVTEELNEYIHKIVMGHPLRGFDAIHLASARVVQERLPEDFVFACFDVGLARAAQAEGFNTFPRLA